MNNFTPLEKVTLLFELVVAMSTIQTEAAICFNIDFGDHFGSPVSTYGAASGQAGNWNVITSSGPTTLLDLNGNTTTVALSAIYASYGWGTSDALLGDNFLSYSGNTWSVNITGMENGTYSIYYYAPSHTSVDTANFSINGTSVPSITGRGDNVLEKGVSWDVLNNVVVSSGTLTLSETSKGIASFGGLAGMQIVSAVPEPQEYAMVAGMGLLGFALWRRKVSFC